MEVDGEVEEQEDRVPELAKDQKGDAKANTEERYPIPDVAKEAEAEAMCRIASSKDWKTILTFASPTKTVTVLSSGFGKPAGKNDKESCQKIEQIG